jgi:drug/metabolite transporter (DMT)-like permease
VRNQATRNKALAWFLLGLLSFIWGSSYILMKKGLEFFYPQEIATMRIFVAAIFLLPFSLPQLKKLTVKQHVLLFLVGMIGTLVPMLCFTQAQIHINSGVHGVLNALTPVFVLLVGTVIFKKVALKNEIGGAILGILGTAVLMVVESRGFTGGFNYYLLLSLLGSFLYGNTTNLIKYYLKGLSPTTIVSVSLLLTGVFAGIYLFTQTDVVDRVRHTEGAYKPLLVITFAGIVNLGLANIILTTLVKMTSPLFTSTEALLAPIVAIFWGMADGEKLCWEHYIGIVAVLMGVYFINRPGKPGKQVDRQALTPEPDLKTEPMQAPEDMQPEQIKVA